MPATRELTSRGRLCSIAARKTHHEMWRDMMSIGSWKTALAEIDVDRIAGQIHLLAEIGRQPTGGVTRLAFSDEDRAARQLLIRFMEVAGLQVRRDPVGNLIGTLAGREPKAPVVMAGSHIDTVVNAGRFDGVLGVLSAV